ncbi:MAG TPA: iron-sulfur cluster assembly scaffold protein [Patescibacteria group bacterium]|nr:iron-sulfur cluster assembly scaffold protein [Patescibacteria group bacterium]
MALYSDKVMDHFLHPRNVGEIARPDGVGEVGNPVCGDMMTFTISVRDGRIRDVKYRTFGCGAAIAVASMASEMAKGKTLDEAMRITNEMVAGELDGLPAHKMHCSNLGADALHRAIENYRERRLTGAPAPAPREPGGGGAKLTCPYCDQDIEGAVPFCRKCRISLAPCPHCGEPVSEHLEHCPHCGRAMDRERGE